MKDERMEKCRKSLTTVLFIALNCCFLFIPAVSANLGGYSVEPVTPDMDLGTPLETVQDTIWDLTPRDIATIIALSISPVFLVPMELFFLLKVFAFFGYRKVTANTVLDNDARSRIYSCIQENPGIFFNALMRMTDVKRGTLRYHLAILKLAGKIVVLDIPGNCRYFDSSGTYLQNEKIVLKYIRNDADCRIFRVFLENPLVTRNDLAEHLGLSLSTVSWHMNRLNEAGIILTQKSEKSVRYRINPEMREYLEKYLGQDQKSKPIISPEKIPGSA